jgi:type IV secretion system protein VirB10
VDASGDVPGKAGQPQQPQQQQGLYGAGGGAAAGASNSRDFLNGPTGQYSCSGQLASANSAKDDYLSSKRAAPASEYEVLAGSIIPAALISGMNSELPGLISAQVRQDVYDSKTGRYLLIPKGSRLIGLYKSGVAYGQSRVLVAWSRLIFPDTSGMDLLNMSGVDVEGNAGLTGTVDNHYGKIFGAALLTSILAIGLQLSQPNQQQQQSAYPSQQQLAAAAASQQIISVGSQLSNRALNIAPTIQIPRGYPFSVMVDRDMTFPGPYQGT